MSSSIPDAVPARGPFADWAGLYRERGFWPRPITLGTKAPHIPGWQRPDHEIAPADLASWPTKYGHLGIGLLMGSPFPDGTTLGASDIDRRRVHANRASPSARPAQWPHWQEGRGVLRPRARPAQQSRVQGSRRRRQALRQGRRVPLRQEALRHPADDPSRNRTGLPLDRERPCTRSISVNCRSWR